MQPDTQSMNSLQMHDFSQENHVIERLKSLDAFRGAVIICMVLINNPGAEDATYPFLTHVVWHGWTFADLIAPAFLWIIGVSMVFSLERRMQRSSLRGQIFAHLVRRSAVICVMGIFLAFLSVCDHPEKWRLIQYMGILQRMGAAYLIAGTIYLYTGIYGHMFWIVAGPSIYWSLMILISVPGFGTGCFDIAGNAASYIDHLLLGQRANLTHSLLSILTCTATISLGVLTGHLLMLGYQHSKKILLMLLFGSAAVVFGEIIGLWVPINRRLWTPSFLFLSAGISTLSFAVFFWLIEIRKYKSWLKPLAIFGMNPFIIFVLSEVGRIPLTKKGLVVSGHWVSLWEWIYKALFSGGASPQNASLLFAAIYVLLFYVIAYGMHHKGWIIKI